MKYLNYGVNRCRIPLVILLQKISNLQDCNTIVDCRGAVVSVRDVHDLSSIPV